jgi:uncharacterized protein (TIGR02246 family)
VPIKEIQMLPHRPEEWPGLFERYLNAGDLEAAAALYDPDASFVPESGDTVVGRDAIRAVLSELIAGKARLRGKVARLVTAGDIAVLYSDWEGTMARPSGEVAVHAKAVEVLRRQPDGTWLLVVGDPNGRG